MSVFAIEGWEVGASTASRIRNVPFGTQRRGSRGLMRSNKLGDHRAGTVVTDFMDGETVTILRTVLASPGPLLMSGALLGEPAGYFHVTGQVEIQPLGADLYIVSFPIAEDDFSSPLLFSFDGDAPGLYTHTRSGAARYRGPDEVQASAADGVARVGEFAEYVDVDVLEVASYLGGPARTNLVSSDDISGVWGSNGTPVVTGSISDPAGGTGAFTIADDDGAAVEGKTLAVTFTGDGTKAIVYVVRERTMPGAGNQGLHLFDSTATASRLVLLISGWVGGEPQVTASTGAYLGRRYIGNGYWAVIGLSTSVTAANTNVLVIEPAVTTAQTGSIDVWRVNAYNATVPSWAILDASGTIGADELYGAFPHAPQAQTSYTKFVEGGTILLANTMLWYVGHSSFSNPRLRVFNSAGNYRLSYTNDAGTNNATLSVAPVLGDLVEIRAVLNADGSIVIGQSINGGAETTDSAGTALGLDPAWSDTRRWLNCIGSSLHGFNPIITDKVVRGVYSMDQMRNLSVARAWKRVA